MVTVESERGEWRRTTSSFRNWIVPAKKAKPENEDEFPAESGRYHLYAAWNCPWAHRALLTRKLKKLENIVSVSFAAPRRDERGWIFNPENGYTDDIFGDQALVDIYRRGDPDYAGRITVPLLWDIRTGRIVSNESADIIVMFNSAFADFAPDTADLYPASHRTEIDRWNKDIYAQLNNGVYRAGFAESQEAYEAAFHDVFDIMGRIEAHLGHSKYLAGSDLTLADIRLFPTLVRFDIAYFGAFKCNLKRLIDYPNLWRYARAIYSMEGIAGTVKFDIYKRGYFSPSEKRNPYGIIPAGPTIDWTISTD